jgi:hypothetical protein
MIGAASGLYGFMQMANGAVCTLVVGFSPANPALSAATVLLVGLLLVGLLLVGLLLGQFFFLLATRAGP